MALRSAAGLLLALLLAGCAPSPNGSASIATEVSSSPAGPSSSTAAPPSGQCPDSGVAVSVGGEDAASGLRAITLVLTNCSAQPYDLDGYAELALLEEDGVTPLSVTVRTDGTGPTNGSGEPLDQGPVALQVQPGQNAYAVLTWRNLVTDGEAVTAEQISIAPQPGGTAQVVALHVDPGTTGEVQLTAWRASI